MPGGERRGVRRALPPACGPALQPGVQDDGSAEEAEDLLQDVFLHAGLQRRNAFGVVDYTVALPQDANVTVKSVAGDVRVTNVRGELRAGSVNGDVTVSDAPRVSALKSVSGNVQLTNGAFETSLDVNTVSGDLTVRGFKARTLDAGSVSGTLRLEVLGRQNRGVRTLRGSFGDGSASVELQSFSGDIAITRR